MQKGVRCARTGWEDLVYHCARGRAGGLVGVGRLRVTGSW